MSIVRSFVPFLALVAACGGGSHHTNGDLAAPPDLGSADLLASPDLAPTLAIDPAAYVVPIGRSMIFSAKNVTSWDVEEGSAGGVVDASGSYTAPMTPGTYHVTATDGTLHGRAVVTVADFQVSVLAGQPGGSGELDGVGGAARFNTPVAVVADGNGSLYVGDNYRIRKIDLASGAVTTLTDPNGTQLQLSDVEGMTIDAVHGVLYISEAGNRTIDQYVISTRTLSVLAGQPGQSGSANGVGFAAQFYVPRGIVFDGANTLYVADEANNAIRAIDVPSRTVSLYAGVVGSSTSADNANRLAATFTAPRKLALMGSTLLVSDLGAIRSVTSAGGTALYAGVEGVAGIGNVDGPRTGGAQFGYISGLFYDGSSAVYVTDSYNELHRIDTNTNMATTVAGSTTAGFADNPVGKMAGLHNPAGMTMSGTLLYFADGNAAVRSYDPTSTAVVTIAGTAAHRGLMDGALSGSLLIYPAALAYDGAGHLYAGMSTAIRAIDLNAMTISTLVGGTAGHMDGTGTAAAMNLATGLVSTNGVLYESDFANNVVRKVTLPDGTMTTPYGDITMHMAGYKDLTGTAAQFSSPYGLTVDGNVLYVADSNNNAIRRIDLTTGGTSTLAGGTKGSMDGMGTGAQFYLPYDVVADGAGHLFVADCGNDTIREIDLTTTMVSTIVGQAGQGGTADGIGTQARATCVVQMQLDDAKTTLYLGDQEGGTVRRVYLPTGAVSTLAGQPNSPDGVIPGSVTSARLGYVNGLALTGPGTVVVSSDVENVLLQIQQK